MARKLFIVDERMLKLMHYVVSNSLMNVESQKEFCESIGLLPGAVAQIRMGERGFTPQQIHRANAIYGVNVNYIFGNSEKMFDHELVNDSPIELLKKAVAAVDAAYSTKTSIGLVPRKKSPSVK